MQTKESQYLAKLLQVNPLQGQITDFERRLSEVSVWDGAVQSGDTRQLYLDFAEARVRQFAPHQHTQGAIMDPEDGHEREYATASYAMAGAVLLSAGRCQDLESSVLLAMDWSCHCLGINQVPDGHADFVTHMLVQAYRLLKGRADAYRVKVWEDDLRRVEPEQTYTQVERNFPLKQTRNWTTYAMHGEMMRYNEGFTDPFGFIDKYVAAQLTRFTPEGFYRDPNLPAAYDLAARDQLSAMLEEGYKGQYAEWLGNLLERGMQNMLFTQSISGEMSFGGRSNQVVWNEITFSLLCEREASRRKKLGDLRWAGVFKRAAALAIQSVRRWMDDPDEFRLVKNRFTSSKRMGWEFYAYYSTYSLYAAKIAASCYLTADDSIPAQPAPCEIGGYVVFIKSFHRVYASSGLDRGGYHLGFDVFAQQGQDASGLVRLHRARIPGETALSMGIPGFTDTIPWQFYRAKSVVPSPEQAVSICPIWQDGYGTWHRFAAYGRRRHEIFHQVEADGSPLQGERSDWHSSVQLLEACSDTLCFQIMHEAKRNSSDEADADKETAGAHVQETQRRALSDRMLIPGNGGCLRIIETYKISIEGVKASWRLEPAAGAQIAAVGVCVPLLAENGTDETVIQTTGTSAEVAYLEHSYQVSCLSKAQDQSSLSMQIFHTPMPNRNGHYYLCQWIQQGGQEVLLHFSLR